MASAIISADKAVLIRGRRERDAAHLAAEIIKVQAAGGGGGGGGGGATESGKSGGSGSSGGGGGSPGSLPFELRVMEVLLDATVGESPAPCRASPFSGARFACE